MKENSGTILTEVRIPYMGSVENATILKWVTKVGETVKLDGILCEVETDKTTLEINSSGAGVLVKQLEEEGAELKVGALIGYLANADASAETVTLALRQLGLDDQASLPVAEVSENKNERSSHVAETSPISAGAPARTIVSTPRCSPYARRLAKEHGIDLTGILIAGPVARVTGDDVLRAVAVRQVGGTARSSSPLVVSDVGKDESIRSGQTAPRSTSAQPLPGYEGVPVELIPHTSRRRTIARRLSEIARTAPHLTADVQVDLDRVLESRKAFNVRRIEHGHSPVSSFAFLVRAACAALKSHPELNATYNDDGMMVWNVINLGIAVDTPDGLVVPVIRDAGALSISEIDATVKALSTRAREGKLTPQDMDGGTFTISNPGSLGPVLRAEAILNAPQVALLGFPSIQQTPIAIPDAIGNYRVEVRPVLKPSLTFDHRALDGGAVVRYLTDFKNRLETMVFDW